jgi:polygalacturonase
MKQFYPLFCILFFSLLTSVFPQQYTWANYTQILKKISPPKFPARDFPVISFGAKGDGKTDCSMAFTEAIIACNKAGGGRVVVKGGVFVTGPIHLLSNVNLYVDKTATILFSADRSKYVPLVLTRFESVECMNYSPCIYAYEQQNIAVTGEGVLDGQGSNDNWWNWVEKPQYGWKNGMPSQNAARKKLNDMAEKNVPPDQRVFGDGAYLRPNLFQPYKCKNILLSGLTLKNSPMWFINPVLSENITIKNVTIDGLGPNNDGCDPECCKYVLIEGCSFNTGDDCIAIKSGRNGDGRRINVPSENIVIRDCKMKDGHGGVVLGSEVTGGIRNVFAERCVMDSPELERAIRFKTNSIRGGIIENIYVRDITVGQVSDAVLKVDFYYEEGDAGAFTPALRNISLERVTSKKSPYGIWIKAYDRSPVTRLTLKNCSFDNVQKENVLQSVKDVTFTNFRINGKKVFYYQQGK